MVNKNSNFNKSQIYNIIEELRAGQLTVAELTQNMKDYEDLISGTRQKLVEDETVISSAIKQEIDQNVKFIMDQIDAIMKSNILIRKSGVNKMHILRKLGRGIKYSYKLDNDIHVIGPKLFKFHVVKYNVDTNTISIGPYQSLESDTQLDTGTGNEGDWVFTFSNSDVFDTQESDFNYDLNYDGDEEQWEDWVEQLDEEIRKARRVRAHLELVSKSMCVIEKSILTDVQHFDLFPLEDLDNTNANMH